MTLSRDRLVDVDHATGTLTYSGESFGPIARVAAFAPRTPKWTWRTRTTKARRYAVIRAVIGGLWDRTPRRPPWFMPYQPDGQSDDMVDAIRYSSFRHVTLVSTPPGWWSWLANLS